MSKRIINILAAVLVPALAACAPEPPPALVIGLATGPVSLDPHTQDEVVTFSILSNMYEGLVGFDPHLKVVPVLADGYNNPDERTWVFTLRRDARFHDGRPLTPEDVIYSLDRARTHPDSVYRTMLSVVHQVRKLDDRTIVIITRRPQPVLIRMLALVGIVPAGFQPDRDVRGTGPYRMIRYTPRQELTMAYFPQYRSPAPEFQTVTWRFIGDDHQRAQALIDGHIDLDAELGVAEAEGVEWQDHLAILTWHGSSVSHLGLDVRGDPRRNPLADRRVRQAISLAINRQELVDSVYPHFATVATQLVPSSVVGFAPDLPVIRHDPDAARKLLQAAGYRDGLALTLDLSRAAMAEGQLLSRQLADAGVRLQLALRDWSELYTRISRGESPFFLVGYIPSSGDVGELFNSQLHSHSADGEYGAENVVGYANPELDQLAQAADCEFDPRQRQELLQAAMRLVMADLPYIPMYTRSHCYGLRRDLQWQPRADSTLQVREIGRRR